MGIITGILTDVPCFAVIRFEYPFIFSAFRILREFGGLMRLKPTAVITAYPLVLRIRYVVYRSPRRLRDCGEESAKRGDGFIDAEENHG